MLALSKSRRLPPARVPETEFERMQLEAHLLHKQSSQSALRTMDRAKAAHAAGLISDEL